MTLSVVAEIHVQLSAWLDMMVWVSFFHRVGAFGLLLNIVSVTGTTQARAVLSKHGHDYHPCKSAQSSKADGSLKGFSDPGLMMCSFKGATHTI